MHVNSVVLVNSRLCEKCGTQACECEQCQAIARNRNWRFREAPMCRACCGEFKQDCTDHDVRVRRRILIMRATGCSYFEAAIRNLPPGVPENMVEYLRGQWSGLMDPDAVARRFHVDA